MIQKVREYNLLSFEKVPTLQGTHLVSIMKTSSLMLIREIIIAYSENHRKHILREQNLEIFSVKVGGTYSNNCALKG